MRVAQAYMDALYAIDQIDLVRVQKRAYEAQKTQNERWLAAGEGNRTDVLETQARYDLALAQEIEAQDNLDAALNTLAAMVGEPIVAADLDAPATCRRSAPTPAPAATNPVPKAPTARST